MSWLLAGCLVTLCPSAHSTALEDMVAAYDAYPHAVEVDSSEVSVVDYEIALGALRKVRGSWSFKHNERVSGQLQRHTWQIVDDFSSAEIMAALLDSAERDFKAELLFACDGRACGPAAQWANRVFQQRVLYGEQDQQHYRALKVGGEPSYRLLIYSAARTADRQYLHVELLRVTPGR